MSEMPTPEELRQTMSSVQDHHKRIRTIEEFLHFPNDIGPADHVTDHISMKENKKRTKDLQHQVVKSVIWATIVFLFSLLLIGLKDWVLTIGQGVVK